MWAKASLSSRLGSLCFTPLRPKFNPRTGQRPYVWEVSSVTCRMSVVSSGYSGFLHHKTDFIIISPPGYGPGCCWGVKPQYNQTKPNSTLVTSSGKLQRMQNRALRICLRAPPLTPIRTLHVQTGVPLLEDRRRAHLLNFMYKRKNNINYLANQGRNTRLFEGAVLNTVVAKRKAAERSIYIKGAAAWNALPASIRNLPSYQIFKYHQKSWLRETLR